MSRIKHLLRILPPHVAVEHPTDRNMNRARRTYICLICKRTAAGGTNWVAVRVPLFPINAF